MSALGTDSLGEADDGIGDSSGVYQLNQSPLSRRSDDDEVVYGEPRASVIRSTLECTYPDIVGEDGQ